MSGSTGKRKKYKKLVLGAAVRAKLASTMLAPLLALGATGLITLAVVEESTMNVLQDPPPAYSWDDGGGQQQGNRPPAEKPKPPEKKPQASPSATPKTSPSPSPSTSPSPSPSTSPSPSPSPSTSPSPSPSPSPSTSPSPSPSAPVYYNDDSGDDDSGGPSTTDPSATGDGGSCVILGDEAVITGKFHLDLGSATSAKVSAVVYLDGSVLTDGVWDPDDLTAYGASGDYPITYRVPSSGTVREGTSLSMVLTVTFEPDGTTQTITIPIDIPAPTVSSLSFSGYYKAHAVDSGEDYLEYKDKATFTIVARASLASGDTVAWTVNSFDNDGNAPASVDSNYQTHTASGNKDFTFTGYPTLSPGEWEDFTVHIQYAYNGGTWSYEDVTVSYSGDIIDD